MIKRLKDIDIIHKKVLIRVDFNVPIDNGIVMDTFRLDATVDTINYCLSQNASVILMSHLGRPKLNEDKYSLYPIMDYLEEKFKVFVHFSEDCISDKSINTSNTMLKKEIHLLENLRYYTEEVSNDTLFAEKLSQHGDVYINDLKPIEIDDLLSRIMGMGEQKLFKLFEEVLSNAPNSTINVSGNPCIHNEIATFISTTSTSTITGKICIIIIKTFNESPTL